MNKINKTIKSITLLFSVIFLVVVNINAQTAVKPAGNGTFTPYQIETLENLYWVTQNPNEWWKDFEQTADIDASSTSGWDSGNGFKPIGNSSIRFTGTYDGNGFTITGLFINRSSTFFVGMFGVVEQNAKIKNLGLINIDITGRYGVGGLVGTNGNSTITACYSSGAVSDNMNAVGGLVGVNASSGIITSSYSNATVTGSGSYKGGFIGLNEGNINNSYSIGSVNGGGTAGGFAGRNTGTINNSFWDTQNSGLGNAVGSGSSTGVTGKTTAEMKTLSTFINAGWDFEVETDNGTDNYWDFDRLSGTINNGYPFLFWQNGSAVAISKGDNLTDAIDLGDLQVGSYSQGQKSHNNNTTFYTNQNTASAGSDVYYKINIIDNVTYPGHIGGSFRIYGAAFNSVIYLLDASGNRVAVNDGTGNNSQIQDFTGTLTAGTYYVIVDGADASQMGTFSLNIRVSLVPDAKFTSNPEKGCSTPHTVFFTDQSFNPDIWQWNFGDGGTSTAKNPIHTYTTSGTFIVTLAIQDTIWGGSDTFADTVVVSNLVADFSGTSLFGCGPLTVDFTDASVGAVSWEWTFGDGGTSTEQNPSHTYNKPGAYTVTLKTTNSTGCDDTLIKTNYVQVIGPDVNFGIASKTGTLPLTVTFRDSTIAGSPIVSWSWDLGDGGTSNLQNPSHTYTTAGSYNVSLTVNDLDGCSRTLTKNGIVNTGSSVTINQAAGQSDPSNSSAINFTVVFSEPVTGFETGDVTLSGTAGATTGTVTEITPNDGTTYNIAVTGMKNDGTVIANITAGVAVNAGNVVNLASSSADNIVTFDNTPPSGYTVSMDQAAINSTNSSLISFTFAGAEEDAEYSYTFSSSNGGDEVTGGGTITSANQQISNIDLSGLNDGEISLSVTLTDIAGNIGDPVTDTKIKDTQRPSVVISTNQKDIKNNVPFTIEINFSEVVTGLEIDDLVIGNGTADNFENINNILFKVDITSDVAEIVTVNLPADAAQDNSFNGNTVAEEFSVTVTNNIPVLSDIEESVLNYFEDDPAKQITNEIIISDFDDANIERAVIRISGNYQNNEDVLIFTNQNGILGSWNSNAGILTLNGSASQADYQKALRSVAYMNTTFNPNTSLRTIGFTVNDGDDESNTVSRQIVITPVNNPPVLTGISGTNQIYTEGDINGVINGNLTLSDNDDTDLDSAYVQITGNYNHDEDSLGFIDDSGTGVTLQGLANNVGFTIENITVTWNTGTGKLLLNGKSSVESYQELLRRIKYENLSKNPDTSKRTISFNVFDNEGRDSVSMTLSIKPINDAPEISFQLSPYTFDEDEVLNFKFTDLYPFVNDPDNPDSSLIFTFDYTGDNLTIKTFSDTAFSVTPSENWFGLDTITVNVSDGKLTSSASLAINVNSVNDIPVFENIPDTLTITSTDGTIINIYDIVGDVETPDSSLYFEFTPTSDSLFCSFDSEFGELTLNVETGYIGSTGIIVKATDEDGEFAEETFLVKVSFITGIKGLTGLPKDYELYQSYPNPFNPSTTIRYGLPSESKVNLIIYNILGEQVAVLRNITESAGYYEVTWSAGAYASGVYIYRLTAESIHGDKNFTQVKKMILMK